jgi:hypothetical protein
MRFASLLFLGFGLVAALPSPSRAATLRPADFATRSGNVIEVAGPRCGRYYHYVRGHRSRRDGHWIRGHCVRNRD